MLTLIKKLLFFIVAFGIISQLSAADPMAPKKVTITKENGKWRVAAPTMEAFIEVDGTVSRLRVPRPGEWWDHVPNYIKTGIGLPKERPEGGSRGAFFLQNGEILNLSDIKQLNDKTILANNDKASIKYEFTNTDQTWTLTNKTDAIMQFLLVIDGVNAIKHDSDYRAAPLNALWKDVTWFQGNRKLRMQGLSRLWAPGPLIGMDWKKGFYQVCEVTLPPKASKKLILTQSVADRDEMVTISELTEPVKARGAGPRQMVNPQAVKKGDLTILSPSEYQVFQRQKKFSGKIFVSGNVVPKMDKLQVRITGKSLKGKLKGEWQDIAFEKIRQTFSCYIPCVPGGWYKLEFQASNNGKTVAQQTVDHVGLGEVFVGCGQSNSTNYGNERTKTETRMVSTFSGSDWRIADDPQPGTHDHSQRGSFWPSFGDDMYRKYKVPIGVAATGHGGAPVTNWQPGKHAFTWTVTRILELGPNGFRALLWHQGETNATCTADYYFDNLSKNIKAMRAAAKWDFPWFVANVSYRNPKQASFPGIRKGQQRLWKEGIALEGPDTDKLVGDDRAGIHLSKKGLKNHGKMWAEKVSVYLDKILE